MKIEYNPDLKARLSLDDANRVRAINHSQQYWSSEKQAPAPVAIDYLNQMADVYQVSKAELVNLSRKVSYLSPRQQGVEYHLSEEKSSFDTTTLGFYQTYLNVPVWQAGFKVTIKQAPYRVIRSVNTSQEGINASLPSDEVIEHYKRLFTLAEIDRRTRKLRVSDDEITGEVKDQSETESFLRGLVDERKLKKYAEADQVGAVRMIRGRFYIYKYDQDERLPKSQLRAIDEAPALVEPTLPIRAVDRKIKDGEYYMVAEITFAYPTAETGPMNWRALVELESASVLYLRALVGSVKGKVFHIDPISASNNTSLTSDQNNATLNPWRSSHTLPNLKAPVNKVQSLSGTYVIVSNMHDPNIAAPTKAEGTDFDYDVRTNDFAAVNAYYHADEFFGMMQDLGFTISTYFNNTDFPVPVDHRAFGTVINAHCVGNGTDGIEHTCYGLCDSTDTTNPIGRAVDSRVFMHELAGHGVLYEHVSSANFTFCHSAGDSLSLILHDPISKITGNLRFDYAPFHPSLRRRCDRDVSAGWAFGGSKDDRGYGTEEILATALFRAYRSIGGDSSSQTMKKFASDMMLYLILRAIQKLTPATNPAYARDFVDVLEEADKGDWTSKGIEGGAYHKVIRWAFEKQGEYQDPLVNWTANAANRTVTTAGKPPEVDVYIDDGRGGEYNYQAVHWATAAIWNRRKKDGNTGHEEPALKKKNYAYVKIKNRGTKTAQNVIVRGYHCKASAGVVWPNDFQAMTTAQISAGTLGANNSEEKTVGPFEWTPVIGSHGHDCMLMVVSADDDASNVDNFTLGELIPDWRLVPNDNNVAQRNVTPVPGGGGKESLMQGLDRFGFWVGNPTLAKAVMQLKVKLPTLLSEAGWRLSFVGIPDNRFELNSGEKREVIINLHPGNEFSKEQVENAADREIMIAAYANDLLIGGMTYQLDPDIREPYNLAREPDCTDQAKELLECLNIKGQDVKKVQVKKVTVDIKLRHEDCDC